MDQCRAIYALKQTARMHGVSYEYICREIEDAINCAIDSADAHRQAMWNQIPRKGDRPTAVEVVAYFGRWGQSQV